MALNVTEFLITDDLKGCIEAFAGLHPGHQGFVTVGCLIIESPDQIGRSNTLQDRIWDQYHFGLAQKPPPWGDDIPIQRARLIHQAPDGRYGPGRHSNGVSGLVWPLYLFWYGWCPLYLKKLRNEAMRQKIPPENVGRGWGAHHVYDDQQVEAVWRSYLPHCHDLLAGAHPALNRAVENLREAR
jgi:hypothetical protein